MKDRSEFVSNTLDVEQVLRESEKKYRIMGERAGDGVIIIQNYRIKYINKAFCRMSGYLEAELLDSDFAYYLHRYEASRILEQHRQCLEGKRYSYIFKTMWKLKNGRYIPIEVNSSPIVYRGQAAELLFVRNLSQSPKTEKVTSKKKDYLNSILQESPLLVCCLEPGGKALFVNRSCEKVSGYHAKELIGKNWWKILYPGEDYKQVREFFSRLKKGNVRDYEMVLTTRSGEKRTIIWNSNNRYDEKEKLVEIICVGNDITERKQAEEALRLSEEKYRQILSSIEEGYYESDLRGNITFLNDSFCRISGYSKDELLGKNYKLLHKPGRDVKKMFKQVFKSGVPEKGFTCLLRRKSGEKLFVELSISPIFDNNNVKCTGFRGLIRDVTERMEMEKVLAESEERFRYMAEFSPFPLAIIDLSGRYEYINPKYFEVFGYSLEDVPDGKSWFSLAFPDSKYRREVIAYWFYIVNKIEECESSPAVLKVTCKDGSVRDILFRVVKAKAKYLIIYEDVTERKKAEEKIKYLSFHDKLTGLYNRAFFEEELKRLDTERQMPLSIIIGDVNGLKLVNDAFGHKSGDHLLISIAALLRFSCRDEDIICRWGGDEFAILLPQTSRETARLMLERIKKNLDEAPNAPIRLSMALGCATKEFVTQDIEEVLKKADGVMYSRKVKEDRNFRNFVIANLLKTLGEKDYETEEHVWRMQKIGIRLGSALGLSDTQLGSLVLAIALHDIGKVAIPEEILRKAGPLEPEEWEIVKEHSEKGYRIILSSSDLAHIAPKVLFLHERWDGQGYPQGLKGKEIPLLSRILAIIDAYDAMMSFRTYRKPKNREQAMEELRKNAGSQFDPHIVQVFLQILQEE